MKPALFLDNGFFKSEIRRSIEKSGYKIILNVGDLNSDHVGYPSMLNCKGIQYVCYRHIKISCVEE